jgi:hypothetical protein
LSPESSVLVGGPKPAALLRGILEPPPANELPGAAITLGEAVRGAVTRSAQTQRVQAYWDLSAAAAHYYLALVEADELAALRARVSAASDAWDAAQEAVEQRVLATRQAALASQLRLQRLMGSAAPARPPLPADAPHCGRYDTRYEEIFIARNEPLAQQLHQMLPLLQAELAAAARQVDEAYRWINYVDEHRDPVRNDGTGLLRSYELMSARRQTFIDAVHRYNDHIAAYAELATPDQVAPDRLAAMLIRVSTANDGGPAAGVRQAGAFEAQTDAAPGGDAEASAPDGGRRTFAQRLNLEDRRLLSRFRNRERSIVVRRGALGRAGRGE